MSCFVRKSIQRTKFTEKSINQSNNQKKNNSVKSSNVEKRKTEVFDSNTSLENINLGLLVNMALQRVNSLCTRMPQKHPTPPRRSTTEGKILLKSKREIDGLILFQKNLKLFDRNIYDNTSAKIFTRSRLNTLNGVAPVRAVPTNKTVNKKITKARSKVTNKPAANDHRTNKAGLNTQDNSEAAEPVLPPSPAPANIPQHEFQRTMTSIGAVFAAEPKTSQLRIENDAFDLTVFPFAVEFYPLYTGITFAKLANCIGIVYMKPLAIRKWSFLKKTHLVS